MGAVELATIALMWDVMMVAMMTTIASPMVLAFAGLSVGAARPVLLREIGLPQALPHTVGFLLSNGAPERAERS